MASAPTQYSPAEELANALTHGLGLALSLVAAPMLVIASARHDWLLVMGMSIFGASMIALLATAVVAPIVIAFAWFFYRPLYAVGILIVGFAIAFGLRQFAAKRAAGRHLDRLPRSQPRA